jgi:hypothetical protein
MTNGNALSGFTLTTRVLSGSQYNYIFGEIIRVTVIHSFTQFTSKLAYLVNCGCVTWRLTLREVYRLGRMQPYAVVKYVMFNFMLTNIMFNRGIKYVWVEKGRVARM